MCLCENLSALNLIIKVSKVSISKNYWTKELSISRSAFFEVILQIAPGFESLVAVVAGDGSLNVSCLDMVDHRGFALRVRDLLTSTALQLRTFRRLDSLDVSLHLPLVFWICALESRYHRQTNYINQNKLKLPNLEAGKYWQNKLQNVALNQTLIIAAGSDKNL